MKFKGFFAKSLFVLLAITFISVGITKAQALLGENLITLLQAKEHGSLIPINIRLTEQYENQDLYQISLSAKNPTERRQLVINELKQFSYQSQSSLLDYLNQKVSEGSVENIHTFWLGNMIHCSVETTLIYKLAERKDIAYIDYNREFESLTTEIKSEFQSSDAFSSPNNDQSKTPSIAWNVTHINADQVWEQGFSGQDVIVAVLDGGVNYEHTDLQGNLWEHPLFPFHGYNFVENNFQPMDFSGHGTHCAGIVAGNGSSGVITGVAPNAKIMAVKVLNDQGGGNQANVWAGIEFAVEYGADVINMSLGFLISNNPDRAMMRTVLNNARNAGVISTVAAGNEGGSSTILVPYQVRTPGDVPPPWLNPDQTLTGGTSGVVSVGSINSNNAVASNSSRGPVEWGTVNGYNDYAFNPGMGLIRPDIVSPGVQITSLDAANTTGYTIKSGTSMAAPAVAGVIALMLSKNPYLLPEEISQILEESANALSFAKSNISGSGVVNALTSIQNVPFGVIYHSHELNDNDGNNDGKINPGEHILLDLTMRNPKTESAQNVVVNIETESPFITLLNNQIQLGNFEPGEIKTLESAIAFDVSNVIPGRHEIIFKLSVTESGSSQTMKSNFSETAFAPNINMGVLVIDDSEGGNNNGILEPGESGNFIFSIKNSGQLSSENLTLNLSALRSYTDISEDIKTLETMGPDEEKTVTFQITAHPSIPEGSIAIFDLDCVSGSYLIEKEYKSKLGRITESWESGDFSSFDWQLDGVPNINQWYVDGAESYDGNFSLSSGLLFPSQESYFSITLEVEHADTISFYRKQTALISNVSLLGFFIDNKIQLNMGNVTDWVKHSFPVEPGVHTFKWRYFKLLSDPTEKIWIDRITLPASPENITFAGFDSQICGASIFHTNGFADNFHSLEWLSTGDGNFDQPNQINCYYTPGQLDTQNGEVNLILKTYKQDGSFLSSDTVLVQIFPAAPIIELGDDIELCMTETLLLDAGEGFASYSWVNGSTERTLLVTAAEFSPNAEIWVQAYDANGCLSQDTINVVFNDCTSLNNQNNIDSEVEIFPNPASQSIMLKADEIIEYVTFLNSYGSIIEQRHINKTTDFLDVSNLKNGLYILKIKTDINYQTKRLLIINE
jgi:subtilisin family serine protease